ncbi:MAG: hypothetical protein QNK20_16635 [Aureibaculum sp.]|nr:hypothetical protein [Aureibaculum sp.]
MTIYELIETHCKAKEAQKVHPASISMLELCNLSKLSEKDVRARLNGLYKKGLIKSYDGINYEYFKLV